MTFFYLNRIGELAQKMVVKLANRGMRGMVAQKMVN